MRWCDLKIGDMIPKRDGSGFLKVTDIDEGMCRGTVTFTFDILANDLFLTRLGWTFWVVWPKQWNEEIHKSDADIDEEDAYD